MKAAGVDGDRSTLETVSESRRRRCGSALDDAAVRARLTTHGSPLAEAEHAQDGLLPAMAAVRAAADALEDVVADDLWPLPTYQEMLYIL